MNKKKSICIMAQFPPPIHGLSKAVQILWDSRLQQSFNLRKINLTNNFLFPLNLIKTIMCGSDIFYLTISSSRGGNIRDLIFMIVILLKRKKIILHLHGSYYRKMLENETSRIQRKLNFYVLKRVSLVIVLSESLKKIFNGMIEEDKIFVVSNCVDEGYVPNRNTFLKKIGKKNVEKKILYISNLIESKGYRKVLQLALLEKINFEKTGKRKYSFEFAGDFFEEKERLFFFNFIKKNGLENFVSYKGVVDGEDKKKLLLSCDIFILLTNYPKEGQPISILEAMANGLFIVTTNHAGIPDVIKDGYNGMVVDADRSNLEFIYTKLSTYNCDDIHKILERNYKVVQKKYTEKLYINNMENVYKRF